MTNTGAFWHQALPIGGNRIGMNGAAVSGMIDSVKWTTSGQEASDRINPDAQDGEYSADSGEITLVEGAAQPCMRFLRCAQFQRS